MKRFANVDERALREPDLDGFKAAHRLLASNRNEALARFQELAEQGSMLSLLQLARAYSKDLRVEHSPARAEAYYRRAANLGSLYAYYALGRMFMAQNRVDEATSALSYASAKGYPPAIHYLAKMYLTGKGVGKNSVLGMQMLDRAKRRGSIGAKATLSGLMMRDSDHPWNVIKGIWTYLVVIGEIAVVVFTEGPSSEMLG
jgi:TPR repeat protein